MIDLADLVGLWLRGFEFPAGVVGLVFLVLVFDLLHDFPGFWCILVCLLGCLCLCLCFRALCFVFVFGHGWASLTVLLVAVCGWFLVALNSGFEVLWIGYEWWV